MRKIRSKKKNYFVILVLLLLGLGVGYALISTDLTITGIGKFSNQTWEVYFDNLTPNQNNVTLSAGDVAASIDTSTNTDISFTVTLQEPGDFYEFTVDVVNDGTLDAMIGLVTNNLNGNPISTQNPVPTFARYTAAYSDGVPIAQNHLLEANGGTETFKVRVEYRTDIDPEDLPGTAQTLTFAFGVQYIQADSNAIEKPLPPASWVLPSGRTVDNLQVGDEICLDEATTECFNFIRYDGTNNEDVVLLAKYNLKVGRNYESGSYSNPYTSNDPGYGLQDSTMIGTLSDDIKKGVVAFSYTEYWLDGNGDLKAEYGSEWNSNNIYDTDYVTAPDFSTTCDNSTNCWYTEGYSIAYYVEHYKSTLEGIDYRANIKSARLLTYDEAADSSIGCVEHGCCPQTSFVSNTAFWLGSCDDRFVRDIGKFMNSVGYFAGSYYNIDFGFGVRPVIIVAKSDL